MNARIAVLQLPGVNCETETVWALERCGLVAEVFGATRAAGALRDFDGYVATTTYDAVYDMLRRRFPERTRLKNRLRYLLTHDERFALWIAAAGVACKVRLPLPMRTSAASVRSSTRSWPPRAPATSTRCSPCSIPASSSASTAAA